MNRTEKALQYLDGWNSRDAAAILAAFAPGGTYSDPSSGALAGDGIASYAKGLWSAFPDLSFEVASLAETQAGTVTLEWIMRGTNTGSLQGLPPTGRTVAVPGVDVIAIGPDGITSVRGYFDTRAVPEQLGLQVLVQPFAAGPFTFGNAVAVQSGKTTQPGAFAITTIFNDDAQTEAIRDLTRGTALDMMGMDGFIGVAFFRIGGRGVTISAWERPENTRQLLKGGTHSEAMRQFWSQLGNAAYTSVWVPDHVNPLWVRCTACGKMKDHEKLAGVCSCGEKLPAAPGYF